MPMMFRPLFWWRADTRGAEVISAVMLWTWGLILLAPWDTFEVSPSYRIMSFLAPEWVWGCLYLGLGALQSLAMCGNVHRFRLPAASFAMIGWTFAAITFLLSNPYTHAPVLYGILAFANFWVIQRGPQRHV